MKQKERSRPSIAKPVFDPAAVMAFAAGGGAPTVAPLSPPEEVTVLPAPEVISEPVLPPVPVVVPSDPPKTRSAKPPKSVKAIKRIKPAKTSKPGKAVKPSKPVKMAKPPAAKLKPRYYFY